MAMGLPSGLPMIMQAERSGFMIDMVSELWELLTIFFTTDVIYMPLFAGMILFNLIFWAVYMLIGLLDIREWSGYKF